jgi:flagellar basal body rod protein FlgG
MFRGIDANAQAMTALQQQQDVQANNLANTGTTGFRRDQVHFQEFREVLRGKEMTLPEAAVTVDPTPGALVRTDNPLDLGIEGRGFFAVQTPDGVRYTRNGTFQWDDKGGLVTGSGLPVLGTNGPLRKPDEAKGDVVVDKDGTLRVGGEVAGRLKIAHMAPGAVMSKIGGGLLTLTRGETVDGRSEVRQGALESSTVNSAREMVEMMNTLRLFEANQRSFRLQDEALGRAIQDLGR